MAHLRVGLAGTGWVAVDRYLPVLTRLPGIELVGIADRSPVKALEAATRFRTVAFDGTEELLGESLDVLFVCTSPQSHATLAQEAMRANVHVLVEKPMAVDLGDAEEMVATAEQTGMTLGLSHNLLFSHSFSSALRRVEAGVHGSILHVLAVQASSERRRLPHWYPELPGGLFYDEAPHMLYLLDRLVGPLEVSGAWSQRRTDRNQFTALGADFRGSNGVRATLRMLFDAPVSEWILLVVLEAGVIVIDLFRDTEIFVPPDGDHGATDVLMTSARSIVGHVRGTLRTGAMRAVGRQFWGHDVLIADFLESVRTGTEPLVDGGDGLRVTRTIHELLAVAS